MKSAVRKWFQKQNTIFLKDGFQKLMQRWPKWWFCRKIIMQLAALKIIDVGVFFYFNKISFPFHFLFKWRHNVSARPRIYIYIYIYTTFLCTFASRIRTNSFTVSVRPYRETRLSRNVIVKFHFWLPC